MKIHPLAAAARQTTDSYTLTREDANYVVAEAGKHPGDAVGSLTQTLTLSVVTRCGFTPSRREVRAIIEAVRATENTRISMART